MYDYAWEKRTRGYRLTTQSGKFVAQEIRPVYAEELLLLGFDKHFRFDATERRPLLWCKNSTYLLDGEPAAQLHGARMCHPLDAEFLLPKGTLLKPVDTAAMVERNRTTIDLLAAGTLRRIQEIYEENVRKVDVVYIGFSGGKDSMLLLDLCDKVLPRNCPVVFSDTTMELPDSYAIWEIVQKRYPDRPFLKFSANRTATENWRLFGPPSRTLDWCCSVHKSAPAVVRLKEYFHRESIRTLAFLGTRREESLRRDSYDGDVASGVKNASQINAMPIQEWGAHELFLYSWQHDLPVHRAYRLGLPRVGCLLCPKASEKQSFFVEKAYPEAVRPYQKLLLDTTTKLLETKSERLDFLGSLGWQLRRNGLELKNRITIPEESSSDDGTTILWSDLSCPLPLFVEWLKTLGRISRSSAPAASEILPLRVQRTIAVPPSSSSGGRQTILYDLAIYCQEGRICALRCRISAAEEGRALPPRLIRLLPIPLRRILYKTIACVGCGACEAECPAGALHISPDSVKVDENKCIHCLKCQNNIDYGCWRYKSMMTPNSTNSPLKSIGSYQTFGLQPEWIALYVHEHENLRNTTVLGDPKMDSLRLWFRQCLLLRNSRTFEPTALLDLAAAKGAEDELLWTLIWSGLANNAPLVKWFVTMAAPFEKEISSEELEHRIGEILSTSAKKSGLTALKSLLKFSPLGMGDDPFIKLVLKGKSVLSVKRERRSIPSLALLYHLYVMSTASGRSALTVSEMISMDFESPGTSPLATFGMSIEELKSQCQGLADKYPDFIRCTFTLGLDEVRLFPEVKSAEDVVRLLLQE